MSFNKSRNLVATNNNALIIVCFARYLKPFLQMAQRFLKLNIKLSQITRLDKIKTTINKYIKFNDNN